MEYKNTIITPKTSFPMKAGLPAREPGMLKKWEEMDLYERREWLQSDTEGTVKRNRVCRLEIWCEALGNPMGKIDGFEGKRISNIMAALGWGYSTPRDLKLYGKQRVYVPKDVLE